MTTHSKAAALLDSFNSLPLITPRGRDDIAGAAETVCDAIVTWLKQDDCSETIEDARKRIEDALCDGEVLGELFPDETEEESEMHGEAVGYAMDLVEVAARRAEAVGSMRVRKSLRGAAALALTQLWRAAAQLSEATDGQLSRLEYTVLPVRAREMERGLLGLLDAFNRARGRKYEARKLLYHGLCVAQMVDEGLRGRAGADVILGHPDQTRFCPDQTRFCVHQLTVRQLIRKAECALALPPPPRLPACSIDYSL